MRHLLDGLRVFTMVEMYRIHRAAIEIIESCGLRVEHDPLLKMAAEAGIRVDMSAQMIYPAEADVLETVRQLTGAETPEIREDGAQKPPLRRKVVSRIADMWVGSNHGFVVVRDGDGWRMRPTTRQDLLDFIRLGRALGCSENGPGLVPGDVPAAVSAIHAAALHAKYARGDIATLDSKDTSDIEWITRVMQASGRWGKGREFRTYACARSPLCLTGREADIVYYQVRQGYFTPIYGIPTMGGTSPYTMAADMAQRLAETLGFFTFSRMLTPPPNNHLPVAGMGASVQELEPRRANLLTASPRARAYRIGWTQMQGEFYKAPGIDPQLDLPTDAAEPGPQAGAEKALAAMASVAAGVYTDSDAEVIGSASLGSITTNLALCAEQAVLDEELIDYVNKLLEGVSVDRESLAVEVIKEVGADGHFMGTKHTLRHVREESWRPELFHSGPFDAWIAGGRKGPLELASEKVGKAMKAELPLVISEQAAREIDRVVAAAEKELLG